MLDSKMDIEAKNGAGWTALFYAVDQNKKEYARELILRGANIDVTDLRTGLGVLEYSCKAERVCGAYTEDRPLALVTWNVVGY